MSEKINRAAQPPLYIHMLFSKHIHQRIEQQPFNVETIEAVNLVIRVFSARQANAVLNPAITGAVREHRKPKTDPLSHDRQSAVMRFIYSLKG